MYLGCNERFAISAGLNSAEAIVGKTDFDLSWSTEDAENYRQMDQDVMQSGKSQINFEEPQTVDGKTIWFTYQ